MKRTNIFIAVSIMLFALCFNFAGCGKNVSDNDIWKEAVYTENKEFGKAGKEVTVEVLAEDKSVEFVIRSHEETLGAALLEYNLIEGEDGAYGMYIKKVNGITADYDVNKAYWAITKNGESVMTGVDGIKFSNGEHYELVYTR